MSPWPGGHHSRSGSCGPLDRGEAVHQQLGLLVLQEVQREAVDLEAGVRGERLERVLAGAERVHEHQRQLRAGGRARLLDLPDDQVEERLLVAHRQQRLGAVHAHRGAEPAVELDDGGLGQRLARRIVIHHDVIQAGRVRQRLDRVLEDEARRPRLELAVVVAEDVDRGLVHTGVAHLGSGQQFNPGASLIPQA